MPTKRSTKVNRRPPRVKRNFPSGKPSRKPGKPPLSRGEERNEPDQEISFGFIVKAIIFFWLTTMIVIYLHSTDNLTDPGNGLYPDSGKFMDENVPSHNYDYYPLETQEGDRVTIKFKVLNGSFADVYILTDNVRRTDFEGRNFFSAKFGEQRTLEIDDEMEISTSEDCVLVVDNIDNGRIDDAEPSGEIIYSIEYRVMRWELVGWLVSNPEIPCLSSIIIIAVLIASFVVKKSRKYMDADIYLRPRTSEWPRSFGKLQASKRTERRVIVEVVCAYCGSLNKKGMSDECWVCGHKLDHTRKPSG